MHGDDSPQMMLFAEHTPPPDAAPKEPRRLRMVAARTWRQAVAVLLWLKQPALPMPLRTLDRDTDTEFDYPRHRVVKAADVAPLPITAPRSIFEMGASLADLARGLRPAARALRGPSAPAPALTVRRDGGVVRVVGAQYPANRWTEQREEQERARRARQKPPKPSRTAKTRSRKLLEMIGEEPPHD